MPSSYRLASPRTTRKRSKANSAKGRNGSKRVKRSNRAKRNQRSGQRKLRHTRKYRGAYKEITFDVPVQDSVDVVMRMQDVMNGFFRNYPHLTPSQQFWVRTDTGSFFDKDASLQDLNLADYDGGFKIQFDKPGPAWNDSAYMFRSSAFVN